MSASPLFAKMNLKDQTEIAVVNAPDGFERELSQLRGVKVKRALGVASPVSFALTFVKTQGEVDAAARQVAKAVEGDAVVWFAYPKASSKKYTCEISRDTGWQPLGDAGFEPVRMVAIDEDWTAVRFRRAEYIKTMKRDPSYVMSKAGEAKVAKAKRGRQ
jgi:hypothetical protein